MPDQAPSRVSLKHLEHTSNLIPMRFVVNSNHSRSPQAARMKRLSKEGSLRIIFKDGLSRRGQFQVVAMAVLEAHLAIMIVLLLLS